MAYRRLAERQAEQKRAALQRNWMTLLEGIELIKRADAESKVEVKKSPYHQICDAIDDSELQARWLDEASSPRFGPPGMAWIPDKPENYPLRKRKMRLENGGEINWGRRRWRKLLLFREDMTRLFTVDSNSNATKSLRSLWKNEEGKREVHEAISAVYDPAEEQRITPPNKVEMRKLAQRWLEKHRGASVHGAWIEELAADPQYNARRGKPGATVKGLLLPVSELKI